MYTRIHQQSGSNARRGLLTPAIAVALLVVMACMALVLDRLWLDSARVEMTTCAEAAALAAGQMLVSDESLDKDFDGGSDLEAARQAAVDIAAQNFVAGQPVSLEEQSAGDVWFGQLVWNRDLAVTRFIETDNRPSTVVVTVRRTRGGNNPIALFFVGLTGQQGGDVVVRAEVTLDNRIRGVRPFRGAPVPAIPLAILARDPAGNRTDTWETAIQQRGGSDLYGYDAETGQVIEVPDGIPEITLRSATNDGSLIDPNVRIIDLGTGFQIDRLTAQIRRGWSAENLEAFDGELVLDGPPILLPARARFDEPVCAGLDGLIGQSRICLLYTAGIPAGTDTTEQIRCDQLVAIRVMDIHWRNGSCELTVQPCVVTTRTAVLFTEASNQQNLASADEIGRNRYIYKLYLSR